MIATGATGVKSEADSDSIEFNFTGKCGGELQVRYRGNWEPVCLNSIEDAHVICRDQNCGNATGYENLYSEHIPVVEVVLPNTGLIVGLLVGLLFILVAIVIVIWQRKCFLTILRFKPSAGDKDVELSSKEMQDINENSRDLYDRKSSMFEIDDYEDVDPVMNPMEDESESQDDVSYDAELEVLDDYDDAMPAQAAVSETGERPGSEASKAEDMLVGSDD
ncbi:hypothetical protein MHYP_G00326780 [Metynnis hypsauchen]